MKIKNSIAHHIGFGSNKKKNREKMDKSRNWHYCWSSLYFKDKFSSRPIFYLFFIKMLLKYFIKFLANFMLQRKKHYSRSYIRFTACINYVFIKKANYRIKH